MKPQTDWSRRNFLRGLGAAIALPSLPSAIPLRGLAAMGGQEEHPLRVAYMFVPNGIHMPDWTPGSDGSYFELPKILAGLEPLKKDLLVLSGLTHDKGGANGDGERHGVTEGPEGDGGDDGEAEEADDERGGERREERGAQPRADGVAPRAPPDPAVKNPSPSRTLKTSNLEHM